MDSEATDAVLRMGRHFHRRHASISTDLRTITERGGRDADAFYRDRWSHDKVVRCTHGVNCTGSCSWKVYVKDGIITWEAQQTDYPTTGPESPEYEPRGCPRGAAFSWYTYSPTRVRYPYARGLLPDMYRQAKAAHGDPVLAWASIVEDPDKARRYKTARGKGGLVRTTWEEAVELAAAAHVYTIKRYGPDRVAGFSPILAMSMASYSAGTRFYCLLGGTVLSFYDWYADLPPASPQVWGDQTDVPESADWWNAAYLIMWGSNVPVTRTADAHFMAAYISLSVFSLPVFVVGHWWRYRYDKFGWTTRSSQMYESQLLKIGSPLFHFGLLFVFGGHVLGLVIPKSWTEAVGISQETVLGNSGHYDYREGVSLWWRGIFSFNADPQYMVQAPLSFQLHTILACLLFALWPFTRLVHVFSAPLWYLWRPYVVDRDRADGRLGTRGDRRGWERSEPPEDRASAGHGGRH